MWDIHDPGGGGELNTYYLLERVLGPVIGEVPN